MSKKSRLISILRESAVKLLTQRGSQGASTHDFFNFTMKHYGNELHSLETESLHLLMTTYFNKIVKPSKKTESGQVDMLIAGERLPFALPIPGTDGTFITKLTMECTIREVTAHNELVKDHAQATFIKYTKRKKMIAHALETSDNDDSWTMRQVIEANKVDSATG